MLHESTVFEHGKWLIINNYHRFFFFQAEDGIRDYKVTGVQTCALPICRGLCESAAMVEYVETLSPSPALLPADAFEAAKVRELCVYLDLHLELVARILYPQAFFGGQVSDSTREIGRAHV